MQQYGLDQVIDELKTRGIKAGEDEATRIVEQARARAKEIRAEAEVEAEEIRARARAQKKATLAAMESEMAQAARVGLAAFRQSIEKGFLVPEVDESLHGVLGKPGFLENALLEIVKAFAASGMSKGEVDALLPEARRAELGTFFLTKLKARGAKGLVVRFDDSLSFGFRIGPRGGGFSFDLSDEGFREVFVRFLSPRFRKAFCAQADAKKTAPEPEQEPKSEQEQEQEQEQQ